MMLALAKAVKNSNSVVGNSLLHITDTRDKANA